MNYRSLGRTGVQVSPLCVGTMNFGRRTDERDAIRILHRAMDAGVNFIDTANIYNRGRSEEIVGNALQESHRRDRAILATKVHGRMSDDDPNMSGNHRRHILQQCDASLCRLKTDWIDLYQIHRPQSIIPIDETLRALDDLIRAGKVRYIGTSTYAAWQVVEALWVSKELGLHRFISEQPPYHLLDRRVERELLPMAETFGIAVLPWSPLAGGFLTGKYERGQEPPQGTRHEKDPEGILSIDRSYDVVDRLKSLAEPKGCTVSQLALAWCVQQEGVTSPIIGPRTMEQLDDNLAALQVVITKEDRTQLDEVAPPGGVVAEFYQADFGPEMHRI